MSGRSYTVSRVMPFAFSISKNVLKMYLKDEMRKEKPIPASEKEKLQD